MRIARDVADAITALDPPVLAIVEERLRRRIAGDSTAKVVIPCQMGEVRDVRPTFRSGKIIGYRGYDVIPFDIDAFFAEIHERHQGWRLRDHQRKWAEEWVVVDPLAWAVLKPYTPDERRAILYAIMPSYEHSFAIGETTLGLKGQSWQERQRDGDKLHLVARRKNRGYDWRENVLTVKGIPETTIKGLVESAPPLRDIVDMGGDFEAEALRYAASRHEKNPCLKIHVKPIHKTLDEDAP